MFFAMSKFKYLLLFLMMLFICTTANAQTQLEINEQACQEYAKKDKELNNVYEQILKSYKADTLFISKLKIAQRAWIAFRDAHLEALYPATDKRVEYGSIYPTCRCNELATITAQRTKELKRWLNGVEEGDTCSGSIKVKE